jgi:rare lipoprotein A
VTKDYGPDAIVDVSHVRDAIPKVEPLSRGGNRSSYEVLGKTYSVMRDSKGYKETGGASWYGKKFHGYLTANGEKYDMYGMSAAHKSLPIPTYVSVRNLANNKSVIVRVNDRGPFHKGRVIDLSYAAASKLDMLDNGTAQVEVVAIDARNWNEGKQKVANTEIKKKSANDEFSMSKTAKPSVIDNLQNSSAAVAAEKSSNVVEIAKNDTTYQAKPKLTTNAKARNAIKSRTDKYLGIHYIQVGVYSTEKAAHDVTLQVNKFDLPALISEIDKGSKHLYKVILGPMKSRTRTEEIKLDLADMGFSGAHLIDLPK